MFLCEQEFSFLQSKCPGMQFLDHMVISCLVFKNLPVFQSRCTIFQSHQQCMSNPVSPHLYPHLVLTLFFFFFAILIGIWGCLTVILIYIALTALYVLTTSCLSYVPKCLSIPLAHFLMRLYLLLLLNFEGLLYVLDGSPLSDM